MKTLKQQISAIKTAIDIRKALYNTPSFFALDKSTQKRIEKLFDTGERRRCKSDSLRDAATTLIALESITRQRDSFLFGFATKLNAWLNKQDRAEICEVLESYLVEKGLLAGYGRIDTAETIRRMKGPHRPGEIEELKLIKVETLKAPSFKRWVKEFPGATLQDYEEIFKPVKQPTKRKPRGKNRN